MCYLNVNAILFILHNSRTWKLFLKTTLNVLIYQRLIYKNIWICLIIIRYLLYYYTLIIFNN